jgi:hypothetical protein
MVLPMFVGAVALLTIRPPDYKPLLAELQEAAPCEEGEV